MIPLHIHSHFSLLQGTCSPTALAAAAAGLGYRRLALTDTDNLHGLPEFLKGCRQAGVQPLVGAEVTDPGAGARARAVCLAANLAGYRNLCRLLSARHGEPEFSLVAAVAAHREGLVVLSAEADLLRAWQAAGVQVAASLAGRPTAANSQLRQLALGLAIPAVAVPDSYFLSPSGYGCHRLLRAIAANTSLSRLDPAATAAPEAWLASAAEYSSRFAVWPEVLANSERLAAEISFAGPEFGTIFPHYEGERPAAELLRSAAYAGARRRYGDELAAAVVTRLEYELTIIVEKGFADYFLVVRDIVAPVSRTCGRGSGAASLVAYVLGITNVCPLRFNLYFERFLNPGRQDPPDIDIDFAWDERDGVLAALFVKYGDHAAMVCNHVYFQPRMALRETAKAYGLAAGEIGRVCDRLPYRWPRGGAAELLVQLQRQPALREIDWGEPWPEILEQAQGLLGIPRNLSVHPGGVVITPRPVSEYVPVQPAAKGVPIIQWEKDGAEEMGLVKIDLLGNRSLGVIRDAVASLRRQGQEFDEHRWRPEEDPATQRLIAAGGSMGCFYIESPAMRLLQQKAGVGDFENVVLQSSIIRPAANEFIREYVRRLHGGAWQSLHPALDEVLGDTYGIMVYQEDLSRVAVALAGFSHVEADGLRKVISKKDRAQRLADYRSRFWSGAQERGVGEETIASVWRMMMSFDGYSFCKPHSASYAKVSFQAAYLKAHYPAEFMAAVIGNGGGFYSTFAYLSEARRLGLKILPPDVEASGLAWHGSGGQLRVGLQAIKGLGEETGQRLVAERQEGRFQNLADFCARVRPAEDEVRALIWSGALDGLAAGGRAGLLWELAQYRRVAPAGQLFAPRPPPPPNLPATPPLLLSRREFAVLGFLCDRHPIEFLAQRRRQLRTVTAAELAARVGREVRFLGWLLTGKTISARSGEPMEFLTFEDETGLVETTLFPKVYRQYGHLLECNRPFLLSGRVESDYGAHTLTVTAVGRE